jgi:peptide/nickel transport system permease protein
MTGYLIRRTASSLFILWGVSLLVFMIIRLVPGDPITTMLGIASVSDPGLVSKFRVAYGLNQPLPIQYFAWLRHILTGQFGTSITTGEPVGRYVVSRFEASLFLGIVATLFAAGLGLLLGIGDAYTRGFVRGLIRFVTLLGIAVASISIGVAFSYVFAVRLRWLPPSGMNSPISNGGVVDPLRHVLLPAITLAIFPAAVIGRITAGTLDELRNDEFARTVRAMGIPRFRATTRHILPNALLPILTNGAILIGYIVTGAVFVEQVFNWPGIGTMMVSAVTDKDYPVVEAGALVFAGVFVLLNWMVDMIYVLVDPRVRTQQEA